VSGRVARGRLVAGLVALVAVLVVAAPAPAVGAGPVGRDGPRPGAPAFPAPQARIAPAAADPTLVGAGDIASCSYDMDEATAALLDDIGGRVFAAGDLAYPRGTRAQFRDCYDPTWGGVFDRTKPAVGNHEYETPEARGYFDYFGARAGPRGKGWYAFNLGTWRIYVLNSNCEIVRCDAGSKQRSWLKADLAAHPRNCVAAIWHHPLFSSGYHGNAPMVRPLWRALASAGADVVLNGHDHDYERFAPQTARGRPAATKMREFVVGTGGAPLRPFVAPIANSVARNATAHGVLAMTLHADGYDWRFVPVAGETWTDEGSAACD
jgi:Calcineurin-like phosphoesterase